MAKLDEGAPTEATTGEGATSRPERKLARRGEMPDVTTMAKIVGSFTVKGDYSALTLGERQALLLNLCERIGFDPTTKPLDFMVFQGKMTLYINKNGTDQLCLLYGITREIVAGPEVKNDGKAAFLVVTIKASLTDANGRTRSHMDVASLPAKGEANDWMKVVSKGNRRAVLGLVGLGSMGVGEEDVIDVVSEPGEGTRVLHMGAGVPAAPGQIAGLLRRGLPAPSVPEAAPSETQTPVVTLARALETPEVEHPEDVATVWIRHKAGIEAMGDKGLMAAARETVIQRMMGLHDKDGVLLFTHPTSAAKYLAAQAAKRSVEDVSTGEASASP